MCPAVALAEWDSILTGSVQVFIIFHRPLQNNRRTFSSPRNVFPLKTLRPLPGGGGGTRSLSWTFISSFRLMKISLPLPPLVVFRSFVPQDRASRRLGSRPTSSREPMPSNALPSRS